MRTILILSILLLPACATTSADSTGLSDDGWTSSNSPNAGYEEKDSRLGSSPMTQCSNGKRLWCQTTLGDTNCACISEQQSSQRVQRMISTPGRTRYDH
jgi:hypothetical protein